MCLHSVFLNHVSQFALVGFGDQSHEQWELNVDGVGLAVDHAGAAVPAFIRVFDLGNLRFGHRDHILRTVIGTGAAPDALLEIYFNRHDMSS
jgi:hypothetical protein